MDRLSAHQVGGRGRADAPRLGRAAALAVALTAAVSLLAPGQSWAQG